jgi:ATP-dependent DNA helicase Q1
MASCSDLSVEAVMLTGATPKEESKAIFSRLTALTRAIGPADDRGDKEIKLCYVTPEKIAKSKTFTSMLEKLATVGKLGESFLPS